jgi:hypothetical protein
MQQSRDAKQKPGPDISVQDLASRAASRYMSSTVKSVKTPKTAYDFEVSWRAISDDPAQQIQLLKVLTASLFWCLKLIVFCNLLIHHILVICSVDSTRKPTGDF